MWNTLRSIVAFWLMNLACKIAPETEKLSLSRAIIEHVDRVSPETRKQVLGRV